MIMYAHALRLTIKSRKAKKKAMTTEGVIYKGRH